MRMTSLQKKANYAMFRKLKGEYVIKAANINKSSIDS